MRQGTLGGGLFVEKFFEDLGFFAILLAIVCGYAKMLECGGPRRPAPFSGERREGEGAQAEVNGANPNGAHAPANRIKENQ